MLSEIIYIQIILYKLNTLKEKEVTNLIVSKQGMWERFEEGKGRGKFLQLYLVSKIFKN